MFPVITFPSPSFGVMLTATSRTSEPTTTLTATIPKSAPNVSRVCKEPPDNPKTSKSWIRIASEASVNVSSSTSVPVPPNHLSVTAFPRPFSDTAICSLL